MPRVLVTGASRGIGRATSLRLAARGWDVLAGVRSAADGAALEAAAGSGITPIQLDVTSPADLAELPQHLAAGLDAVVNNAGYVQDGPVEALNLIALRRQLEVNVVGQVAVTQAAVPHIRASRGRIVFISSINGRISVPLLGAYSASKYALEAIGDALRVELRPWKIPVILIEPGPTATDLWGDAIAQHEATVAAMSPEHQALYARHLAAAPRFIRLATKHAVPVDRVADAVERALTAPRPLARYLPDQAVRAQVIVKMMTPTAAFDAVLGQLAGVRKPRR